MSHSETLTSSNNPFRRRHASQPHSSANANTGPPPLPPRKPSLAPSLPPRKARQSRSQSVASSSEVSFVPTSFSTPSPIIKKSLIAAGNSYGQPSGQNSIHVIKKSTPANGSTGRDSGPSQERQPARRSILAEEIATAIRQAGFDSSPSRFEEIAQDWKGKEPELKLWNCVDILNNVSNDSKDAKYAMIIVNQPIRDKDIFANAWRSSQLRICADGGANRLYDLWGSERANSYLPDLIIGDLDSIRSDVKLYYLSMNVKIIQDKDEYSTDLMKAIKEVEKVEQLGQQLPLIIIGGLSGRIDQTIHTMSLFFKLRKRRSNLFVLSGESLAWVLDTGSHLINIDHDTMGQTCGILPVGVDGAEVTTKGLKWDLGWRTSFDGDVSTSNHLLPDEPAVYLRTDQPVFWCVEVRNAQT